MTANRGTAPTAPRPAGTDGEPTGRNDICVIYLSEDEETVRTLVGLLRQSWTVWWAGDIAEGDWEQALRAEIPRSRAVVPVLSDHARGPRLDIVKDEMKLAKQHNVPIMPFLIGPAEIPLGFGGLNYTKDYGWIGDRSSNGYRSIERKLAKVLGGRFARASSPPRPAQMSICQKDVWLPSFVFSVSSHETQVTPADGALLLRQFEPNAVLISSYDASGRGSGPLRDVADELCDSQTTVFLDSGNYEAYRKNDRRSRSNPGGWCRERFWKVANRSDWDIIFSFDTLFASISAKLAAKKTVASFRRDAGEIAESENRLAPIIHVPTDVFGNAKVIAALVRGVAEETDPPIVAIPERELGDGLRARFEVVRLIRKHLDQTGKYYPLHLLGTGNPLTMTALASAGADLFDGLEWCRTAADYTDGTLFHFQQLECLLESCRSRIQSDQIRQLVSSPGTPYRAKTLSYNVDFFQDWSRTMHNLIHSGQVETLLKALPGIGAALYQGLSA